MDDRQLNLNSIRPFLEALPKDGNYDIIGGFAVALWLFHYQPVKFDPKEFMSKDVDFRAKKEFFDKVAKLHKATFGVRAIQKRHPELGHIHAAACFVGSSTINIEVLEAVPWVDDSPSTLAGYRHQIGLGEAANSPTVFVLDPVSLFFAKTHALTTDLEKNIKGERNDISHLISLSSIILPYLKDIETRDTSTRDAQIQRLDIFFHSQKAEQLNQALGILQKIKPELGKTLTTAIGEFRNLAQHRDRVDEESERSLLLALLSGISSDEAENQCANMIHKKHGGLTNKAREKYLNDPEMLQAAEAAKRAKMTSIQTKSKRRKRS